VGNTAARDGASVFAGTFLPGLRNIILNAPEINRRRSNLVSQTLQEVVEVPPNNTASTIVLLPREGILAFESAEIPVMIDRIIDVHLETEVITPLGESSVQKGVCKFGYSKDQAREALGEPGSVATNPDGTSSFTFAKGPVSSAAFDADGSLLNCTPRSPVDQLDQATKVDEAKQILASQPQLSSVSTAVLTDNSTVIFDIPGAKKTYRFDDKGNRAPGDYTFLFQDVKNFETKTSGNTKKDFDAFLESQAKTRQPERANQIETVAKGAEGRPLADEISYPSPDISNGYVMVKFDKGKDNKKIDSTSIVKGIRFVGPQPKGN